MKFTKVSGLAAAEVDAGGPMLGFDRDAADIVAETFGKGTALVVIPVARMVPEFWNLRTGLAGAFIQRLINYRLRVAFVGDLSAEIARSDALRDYVRESNRGRDVVFARGPAELAALVR